MTRGTLRIYLGAAPGVGKTMAMLAEGRRRAGRGTDVVVGFCETHGRTATAVALEGLEVMPRLRREYRGATLEEMDLDAVLRRAPEPSAPSVIANDAGLLRAQEHERDAGGGSPETNARASH